MDNLINEIIQQMRNNCYRIKKKLKYTLEEFEQIINKNDYWYQLSWRHELSEDFIEKYLHKFNKIVILRNQTISEDFIIKHINYFKDHLGNINKSMLKTISENFITGYLLNENISWYYIFQNDNLSKEFIEKYKIKLTYEMLMDLVKLPDLVNINIFKKLLGKYNKKSKNKYNFLLNKTIQNINFNNNCLEFILDDNSKIIISKKSLEIDINHSINPFYCIITKGK